MLDFLSLKTEAFGLSINERSIKLVKLERKQKGFKLVTFNEKEIKPGIIGSGIIKDEDSLVQMIKMACNTAKGKKLKTEYVVVSLPEEKSFMQVIQVPQMKEEELKFAVPLEAENYIPLPIDEVYLDFDTIAPIENHLNHLDILIVAVPKITVDSYVSCIKKAGLIPIAFEVESQAIARVLVEKETSTYPTALLNIEEHKAGLIVFSGHSIRFTCSFPVDSNLSETIKKYLSFYHNHVSHEHLSSDDGEVKKIILCGKESEISELAETLSNQLLITVELGNPWINLLNDKSPKFFNDPLYFTTAMGLALRGAKNRNDINPCI